MSRKEVVGGKMPTSMASLPFELRRLVVDMLLEAEQVHQEARSVRSLRATCSSWYEVVSGIRLVRAFAGCSCTAAFDMLFTRLWLHAMPQGAPSFRPPDIEAKSSLYTFVYYVKDRIVSIEYAFKLRDAFVLRFGNNERIVIERLLKAIFAYVDRTAQGDNGGLFDDPKESVKDYTMRIHLNKNGHSTR